MTAAFRSLAVALLATACVSGEASSQAGRRPLGDTLRLASSTKMVQQMEDGPAGAMEFTIRSYSSIVVVFGPGDTIKVWTDSLAHETDSPMPTPQADMSFMLNRVDVGVIQADGTVKQVSAPHPLPEAVAAAARQFGGIEEAMEDASFPIVVIAPERLRPGATWSDTMTTVADTAGPRAMSVKAISTSRVVGDSVIHGVRVIVIETRSERDIVSDMTMGDGAMTMKGTMKNTGVQRQFYSPEYRMYLADTSSETGTGHQEITGMATMSMNTKHTSSSETRLIVRK